MFYNFYNKISVIFVLISLSLAAYAEDSCIKFYGQRFIPVLRTQTEIENFFAGIEQNEIDLLNSAKIKIVDRPDLTKVSIQHRELFNNSSDQLQLEQFGLREVEVANQKGLPVTSQIIIDHRGFGTRVYTKPISLFAKTKLIFRDMFFGKPTAWQQFKLPDFKQNIWERTKRNGREHSLIYLTNESNNIVFMSSIVVGRSDTINLNLAMAELHHFLKTYPEYGRQHILHVVHTHPRSSDANFGFSHADLHVANEMRHFELDRQPRFHHFLLRFSVIDGNSLGFDRIEIGIDLHPTAKNSIESINLKN